MTETIKTLLDPIQNRLNAATPGPHLLNRYPHGGGRMYVEQGQARKLVADTCNEGDREFFYAAPTDTARLLAAVKAVEHTAKNLDRLADGDRHYANLFRKAVIEALGGEA